jgi:hypothetical protein
MKKQTTIEWFIEYSKEIEADFKYSAITYETYKLKIKDLFEQALDMEKNNSKIEARKYYLKGFEDAELTESQNVSHEQTMKDAETFFELVYPIKNENIK